MRAYVKCPASMSQAMYRTVAALEKFAPPEVDVCYSYPGIDLEVLHIIGYQDLVDEVARCRREGHRYAVMQYCLASAGAPDPMAWLPLWEGAVAVWSYYDLPQYLIGTGEVAAPVGGWMYHAPLGVDTDDIYRVPATQAFTILTSGYVPAAEAVLAAMEAAALVDGTVCHLGPPQDEYGDHVHQVHGIGDAHLARCYSASRFVSGLRRIEGFEMVAAEGLVCGARPVCFDRDHYRQWYGSWAEYVPEVPDADLVGHLVELFQSPPRPVTPEEIEDATARFNWETLVSGFWTQVLEAL